ncbi:hypothetical protein GPECTOR_5g105 [Gonium pectorale]|uniref:Uncharacterized protein n=1 Tax=Gonium pectorale TaxID=33097 RepID=A0A150GW58_GONPE|nr:hypothetical protein GPECTOR_5g105 [Gonium pectorale]|eukprot:KXZ53993.1 hypothetical protein GPECTOR_5g105 [Gonium pectorale]
MSRKDIEELLKQLREAGEAAGSDGVVTVEVPLFRQALDGLERLEQALDNRPSLIKKLNEKIIKLEGELEILRNETRVNELERKVQRLEVELQRSYATKNFTLKNGLLEIEKAYRDFISASPAVQGLWDEITLLLVEDKESLPQHILLRRQQMVQRAQEAATPDSPVAPADAQATEHPSAPASSTSFVQRQVDKFKDYTWTPGTLDPLDPNHPHNQHLQIAYPHYFPGLPGQAEAIRGGGDADTAGAEAEAASADPAALAALREQYDAVAAAAAASGSLLPTAPHWGSLAPEPSPLRPVSLFSTGGSDGRPPDASSASVRDELSASLDHLRSLFAQFSWAPTPLGAAAGAAAASSESAGGPRRMPDASALVAMDESLEVSIERLRAHFGQMRWAVVAASGSGGSGAQAPGSSPLTPDARYFDAQAEAILASAQRLRSLFQEAALAAAGAAASAGGNGAGGAGAAGAGTTAGGAPGSGSVPVIPDARYFQTQADAITASVDELLRLYDRSSNANAMALLASGGAAHQGPWSAGTARPGASATGAAAALTPDARAGDSAGDVASASVQPMVDLFSSFLGHLEATRGPGASGPWPWFGRSGGTAAAPPGAAGASGGEAPADTIDVQGGEALSAEDLVRLFAQYVRGWSGNGAAAAALNAAGRRAGAAGAAAASGAAGGSDGPVSIGGAINPVPCASSDWTSPLGSRTTGQLELLPGGGAGPGAGAVPAGSGADGNGATPASSSSPAPALRFRISVNTSDAAGAGLVSAHLSAGPSSVSLASAPGGAGGVAAGGRAAERDRDVEAADSSVVDERAAGSGRQAAEVYGNPDYAEGEAAGTSNRTAQGASGDNAATGGQEGGAAIYEAGDAGSQLPHRTLSEEEAEAVRAAAAAASLPYGEGAAHGGAGAGGDGSGGHVGQDFPLGPGDESLSLATAAEAAGLADRRQERRLSRSDTVEGEAAGDTDTEAGPSPRMGNIDADAGPTDAGAGEPAAGGEWDWAGEDGASADAGPGLVAGGVRFQITLSEITPADDAPAGPATAATPPPGQDATVMQFRADVGAGADAEAMAKAEAELAQLRQVRSALSEQLSATQELVLHLNRQLKGALEGREDMAARAERLAAELSTTLAAAEEARAESDAFMRDLVETKVQLAEVQGEYMQVYQALKRALGNEKDMMAKIDELERILAVVGPGDVALEEDYVHSVGRAAGTSGGAGADMAAAAAALAAAGPGPAAEQQSERAGVATGNGRGQGRLSGEF